MANRTPCPNEDCKDGYVSHKDMPDDLTPPSAKCPTCQGTGWIMKSDNDQTSDEQS